MLALGHARSAPPRRMAAWPSSLTWRSRPSSIQMSAGSAESVQGIGAVIDEVDSVAARGDRESEERSETGCVAGAVDTAVEELLGDLRTARRGLHDPAVVPVNGEDVPVRSQGH